MRENKPILKILISCGSYSWGGLEMISLETAQKLREAGNNIKIICSAGSRLADESRKSGFETIEIFSKDIKIFSDNPFLQTSPWYLQIRMEIGTSLNL
ncbi:MAG: hypothetical protein ACHQIH_02635, partial [Ignavibacteria bacterium]